jgi:hypothetical protein
MPKFVEILDLRGGRNGADPPISLPENQAVEMLNVDHYAGMLGRKRGGSEATTESGGTAFATGIQSIFRHVPGSDAQAAEFWGLDGAGTPHLKRMAGGSTYADVTLTDNFTAASTPFAVAVSLNGKLFIAYDSAVDRLHCYDPLLAAPRVRVVGLRRRHRCSLRTWRIRAAAPIPRRSGTTGSAGRRSAAPATFAGRKRVPRKASRRAGLGCRCGSRRRPCRANRPRIGKSKCRPMTRRGTSSPGPERRRVRSPSARRSLTTRR